MKINHLTPKQRLAEDVKRAMHPKDTMSARTRNAFSLNKPWARRKPAEGEAKARSTPFPRTHYKTGDGDTVYASRPGSMDAFSKPSLGVAT